MKLEKENIITPTLSEYDNGCIKKNRRPSAYSLGVWKIHNEHPTLFQDINGFVSPDNLNHRVSVYIVSQMLF